MIIAPHTSSWDFVYGAGAKLLLRLDCKYLAKKELFRFPLRGILLHIGGVPVDRSQSHGMVDSMVQYLKNNEEAIVIFPPEATRKRIAKWKTGFYHAAMGANVPIVMSFIDYKRKKAGFGPSFMPSGNYENDLRIIRNFYADITAFYPENFALPE
jgi:1-acyl-sn-glycerol-3-phosphate acyltransferase